MTRKFVVRNNRALVVCDSCRTFQRVTIPRERPAIAEATREYGWSYTRPHLFCPACTMALASIRYGAA